MAEANAYARAMLQHPVLNFVAREVDLVDSRDRYRLMATKNPKAKHLWMYIYIYIYRTLKILGIPG